MATITEAERKEFVDAFRELPTETGVDGVPRLVALFAKRNGDVGLSSAQLTGIAREALGTKAEKQVLTFPQGHSGGAVHASAKDQVWQADTASMYTFGDSPDTRGYFMIAVDVFTRFVHAAPAKAASSAEAVRIFSGWPKPQMIDTDGGPEW